MALKQTDHAALKKYQASIRKVLLKTIKQKTPWVDITRAIKAAGIKVDSWFDVRIVIQHLANEGIVYRTHSIVIEMYSRKIK